MSRESFQQLIAILFIHQRQYLNRLKCPCKATRENILRMTLCGKLHFGKKVQWRTCIFLYGQLKSLLVYSSLFYKMLSLFIQLKKQATFLGYNRSQLSTQYLASGIILLCLSTVNKAQRAHATQPCTHGCGDLTKYK